MSPASPEIAKGRHAPFALEPGDAHVGRPCRACAKPLAEGELAVICPRCKSLHHARCWADGGGCSQRGCPQVAERDGAPVRAGSDPHPRDAGRWLPIALTFVILLLIAGVAVNKWLVGGHPSLDVLLSPGADNEAVVALLKGSAELAPEATIVPILTPNAPLFQQKLVVMSAAGPPDIMALPLFDLQQMADAGALAPLSGSQAAIDQARAAAGLGAIPAARWQLAQRNNQLYAVPDPGSPRFFAVSARSEQRAAAVALVRRLAESLPAAEVDDQQASQALQDMFEAGGGLVP